MTKMMTILSLLLLSSSVFAGGDEISEQCRGAVIDLNCYGDSVQHQMNTCDGLNLIRNDLLSKTDIKLTGVVDMDRSAYLLGRNSPRRTHGIFYSQNGAACAKAISKAVKEYATSYYQSKFQNAPGRPFYFESAPLTEAHSGFLTRNLFPNYSRESAEKYAKARNNNGAYIVIYWSENQFINY
ncbi:MAG TPA: hypothetical protein VGE46_01830 [Bdellovibrio sp.]